MNPKYKKTTQDDPEKGPNDEQLVREETVWIPHVHTSEYSDGEMTAALLFENALAGGIHHISITDHDSIGVHKRYKKNFRYPEGYSRVYVKSKNQYVNLISGVEVSCHIHYKVLGNKPCLIETNKRNLLELEILGYGFDPKDAYLDKLCKFNRDSRFNWLERVVGNLGKEFGKKKISIRHFKNLKFVGKPHVVEQMLKSGIITDKEQGFAMLSKGGKFYLPKKTAYLDDAIQRIEQAGGRCGLPHPAIIAKEHGFQNDEVVAELFSNYFAGRLLKKDFVFVEAYYPYAIRRKRLFTKEEQDKSNYFWYKFAQEHDLIDMWVSDYHKEGHGVKLDAFTPPLDTTLDKLLELRIQGMALFKMKCQDDDLEELENEELADDDALPEDDNLPMPEEKPVEQTVEPDLDLDHFG